MIFEEIQIYRSAVIAMVKPDDTTFRIDLRVAVIDGDKSGHIQIGSKIFDIRHQINMNKIGYFLQFDNFLAYFITVFCLNVKFCNN
jgi:hypothetical protein